MTPRCAVFVTANFEKNLAAIEAFLKEQDAPQAFAALLTDLFKKIIPNLETFSEMGPAFQARRSNSMEGRAQKAALQRRLPEGAQLREYINGDYLILYGVIEDRIYLLSIKHHRQLSHDLRGHW